MSDRPNPPSGRRSLRRGDWWLLGATRTSAVGDGLVFVVLPLLAVTLTREPILVAGVAVAGRLPWLVVSLPAGALADRVDRRRLAVTIEAVRALVMVAFGFAVLLGAYSLVAIYLVAATIGTLETAFAAATRASIPTLVDPDDLPRANSYLYTAESAGEQFAGPALGGVLFAWSQCIPFFADAVSFAGSAGLLHIALPPGTEQPRPSTSLADDVRTGLRWFRKHHACGCWRSSSPPSRSASRRCCRCWSSTGCGSCTSARPGTGCSSPSAPPGTWSAA